MTKTRLAMDIGQTEALRFSRTMSQWLYRTLSADKRWSCKLAITPDSLVNKTRMWPPHSNQVPQGKGDLGDRMASISATPQKGPLVIIGTDVPGINKNHIDLAFKELGNSNFVIGPARDGGYWLIGMRRRPINFAPFHGVQWSSENTLQRTLDNIGKRMQVRFLEELEDVDDGLSWRRWKESLNNPQIST